MSTLADALDSSQFRSGFASGLVALALCVGASFAFRRWRADVAAPFAGIAFAAAVVVALRDEVLMPPGFETGVALLALAGAVVDLVPRARVALLPLAVPGALVLAGASPDRPGWATPAVALAAVLGGGAVASFDRRHAPRGLGPPLLAVSAAGLYVTVPDTEQALVVLGAALAIALSAWPVPLARLGSAGSLAAVGILAWAAATGGAARPPSIVGGIAALGLLVSEPIAHLARRSHETDPFDLLDWVPTGPVGAVIVAVLDVLVVLVAARFGGLRAEVAQALIVGGAALAGTAALLALAPWFRQRTSVP